MLPDSIDPGTGARCRSTAPVEMTKVRENLGHAVVHGIGAREGDLDRPLEGQIY